MTQLYYFFNSSVPYQYHKPIVYLLLNYSHWTPGLRLKQVSSKILPSFFWTSWETCLTVSTEQPVNRATSSLHSLSQQQLMSHSSLCSSQGHNLSTDTHTAILKLKGHYHNKVFLSTCLLLIMYILLILIITFEIKQHSALYILRKKIHQQIKKDTYSLYKIKKHHFC